MFAQAPVRSHRGSVDRWAVCHPQAPVPWEPMVALLARIGHPPGISNRTKPKGFSREAEGLGTAETSPGSE
ncbi:MAG: hypothetical protein EBX44_15755 [Betaproteobacteria bacterium]|nr:hypothetical protein [Betaproteobacteria bacterium]NDC04280.1 hypothetical protein [Betaproteobacteria bacterium]NDC86958.1 hypothetical protein [Betaproteobacteria bacterium]NDG83230.1 hypothetical protein [Betaproteobacteria bacterium]